MQFTKREMSEGTNNWESLEQSTQKVYNQSPHSKCPAQLELLIGDYTNANIHL